MCVAKRGNVPFVGVDHVLNYHLTSGEGLFFTSGTGMILSGYSI